MSMITELVERLRKNSASLEITFSTAENLREAADTIEELSAKLQAANMERSSQYYNGGWIPCSERLPEEYGEYICTMSNGNVEECGFVPSDEKGLIPGWATCEADGFRKLDYQDIIAWMPLPQPYKEREEI